MVRKPSEVHVSQRLVVFVDKSEEGVRGGQAINDSKAFDESLTLVFGCQTVRVAGYKLAGEIAPQEVCG